MKKLIRHTVSASDGEAATNKTTIMLNEYSLLSFLLFLIGVIFCLWLDLHFHKKDEAISAKNALCWSVFWIMLALSFAVFLNFSKGVSHTALFLSGYLLEKSLSVDNLFVMMAIFSSFAVKDEFQHRVLYYGILGALVLRMLFIGLGTSFLTLLGKPALFLFGIFVLWSAWKMWQSSKNEEEDITDYSNHWAVRTFRRVFPVHNFMIGHDFFVKVNEGKKVIWKATPLFLCLIVIEISDIAFAFDSVPAVIAVTQEPFLVYSSNIFAILGLRSLFFLLSAAKRYLCHLEKAVIIILIYIGLKMIMDVFDILKLNSVISLGVVVILMLTGILASMIWPEKSDA
jgi:tellurite resistance protein TerC